MFLVVALCTALSADAAPTSERTFKTKTPGGALSDFNFPGVLFISFFLGLVGLAGSIVGTYFFIVPLVTTHRLERDVNDFEDSSELG
jgi:hypothetical protein